MEFQLNRINPNQMQVIFKDGRCETLTNEELEVFIKEVKEGNKEQKQLETVH